MNKKIKYIMAFVILLFLPKVSYAQESYNVRMKVNNKDGAVINVASQANTLDSLSQAEIKQMIDSNNLRDGDTITIHEVSDDMNSYIPNNNIRNISTFNNLNTNLFSGYKYKTSKVSSSEYAANNYFVISAAKGQSVRLTSRYSKTVSTSIIAGDAFIKGDIGGSVTAQYETSQTFNGPPDGSANNTREFRVQFYAKKVSFTQYKLNSSNNQVIATKSGKAAVPTRFALYSIDRKLKWEVLKWKK